MSLLTRKAFVISGRHILTRAKGRDYHMYHNFGIFKVGQDAEGNMTVHADPIGSLDVIRLAYSDTVWRELDGIHK